MFKYRIALISLVLGFSSPALAQVYKSTDADGNVIYSDTPAADSQEVEVTKPNVAQPVEVPATVSPPEPAAEVNEAKKRQAEGELVGEVYVKDEDGRKHLRELKRRSNWGPANPQK